MLLVKKHSMHFSKKLHICNSTYPHICISFAINCICMKTNLLEIDGEPKKTLDYLQFVHRVIQDQKGHPPNILNV